MGADSVVCGQWNKYPAGAHLVHCLSDLGNRKSDGWVGISETEVGFLPENDRQEIFEEKPQC